MLHRRQALDVAFVERGIDRHGGRLHWMEVAGVAVLLRKPCKCIDENGVALIDWIAIGRLGAVGTSGLWSPPAAGWHMLRESTRLASSFALSKSDRSRPRPARHVQAALVSRRASEASERRRQGEEDRAHTSSGAFRAS
jgi:hypothetical protein